MRPQRYCFSIVLMFLAACQGAEDTDPGPPSTILDLSFVTDFAPFESIAQSLRETNSRYTFQEFTWWFSSDPTTTYDSYSLASSRTEYAHAVGLTGAGQIIAIIDTGFLTTHDEFTGKTIYTDGGVSLPVDDHGTAVASIAAGVADFGSLIGVAPEADLHLGSFATLNEMTAATDDARAVGAIVQNNSWGFEEGGRLVDVTSGNFSALFGPADGQAYITALTNYANNGIIVFAASNDVSRTTSDLMTALPMLRPDLESSWIAVINAVPTFNNTRVLSATLLSAGCLEAAKWCIVADGSVQGANSSGGYTLSTGTSFAAPQVSGAIALLAEAFPTLTAQDLRVRLLASADNSFLSSFDGYVEFVPGSGIGHGYNATWGHGFLDIRAALLPIGGVALPAASGELIALNQPLIVGGGASGNALETNLAKHDIMVVDDLGGSFFTPGSILVATGSESAPNMRALAEFASTDLEAARLQESEKHATLLDAYDGRQLSLSTGGVGLSALLPSEGAVSKNFGFSASEVFSAGNSRFEYGLSVLKEDGSFLGIGGGTASDQSASNHLAVNFGLTQAIDPNSELSISGQLGIAQTSSLPGARSVSNAFYNSANIAYTSRNLLRKDDRFSVSLALPTAITNGNATFVLPVARSASGIQYDNISVSLAPSERQVDLSFSYGAGVGKNAELFISATHSLNAGHVAGAQDTYGLVGFQFRF